MFFRVDPKVFKTSFDIQYYTPKNTFKSKWGIHNSKVLLDWKFLRKKTRIHATRNGKGLYIPRYNYI